MSDAATDNGDPGFDDALAELERIVAELESDELAVDHLADRVARAAELVARCRERIDGTRLRVEEILVHLDGAGAPPADVDDTDDGDPAN